MGYPTKVQLIHRKAGRRDKKNGSSSAAHPGVVGREHGCFPTAPHLGTGPMESGGSLRAMVIAPFGYRPRKGSKLLYRQPAYLICTAPDLALEQFIQYYLWRWDVEMYQSYCLHCFRFYHVPVRDLGRVNSAA